MAYVLNGDSNEQRQLLYTQLGYDPNYGGIVGVSESMRSEAGAANVDEPELFLSVSDSHSDYLEEPPSGRSRKMLESDLFLTVSEGLVHPRELPDGQDSVTLGGDPAPNPVDRPLVPFEEEEQEEEVCKCCTSWYDWCLFLSCKLTVLGSPLRMPLRERKCLRRARTEGWRLLWSLVLPLAVGSRRLQLVWVIAQLVTSFALFSLSMAVCAFYGCNSLGASMISVWMFLTLVDTIVCLVAIRFNQNKFVWKISPYITVLRIIYTVICLHIAVFNFSGHFKFQAVQTNQSMTMCHIYYDWSWVSVPNTHLPKVQFGFSFASLCVFVDFTLLVVATRFAYTSLKLRNAYSEAHNQPTVIAVILFLLFVFFELIIHLLFVSSAIFLTLNMMVSDFFNEVQSCNYMQVADSEECCQFIQMNTQLYGTLSITVPLFGLLSMYFIDYFWFQEYFASVCLSVQSILQDRDTAARLRIPENVYERLQERTQGIDPEALRRSIEKFKEVTFRQKVIHLCENPFIFSYSSIFLGCFSVCIAFIVIYLAYPLHFLSSLSITSIAAVVITIVLHLRVIVFGLILLPISLTVILLSPFIVCFMGLCFLLWPLCSSRNCCSCKHFCELDLIP